MPNMAVAPLRCISYALMLTLLSCGIRPTVSSGGSSKYYTIFYAGAEQGAQYFINPHAFATEAGQTLTVDLTFRDGKFATDSATVNYTLASDRQLGPRQGISLYDETGERVFSVTGVDRLFQERTKQGFLSRYTSKVANLSLARGYARAGHTYRTELEGRSLTFLPTRKTQQLVAAVERDIFSLQTDR